jgi:hypothetical protein
MYNLYIFISLLQILSIITQGKVVIESPQDLVNLFGSKFILIKMILSKVAFRHSVKSHMDIILWDDYIMIHRILILIMLASR